jgi:hypothetical protein
VVGVGTTAVLVGTRPLNWQASMVAIRTTTINDKATFLFILLLHLLSVWIRQIRGKMVH